VASVETTNTVTQAPSYFAALSLAAPRAHVSTWAMPVQRIRASVPATQLVPTSGMSIATGTSTANAAKGATRKDATGGEAFEDPV
jgi:hypothetical protein